MRPAHSSPYSVMRYVYGVVALQFVILGNFFFRLPRPASSYTTQGYIRHGRDYTRPSPSMVAPVIPPPPNSPTTRVAILMAYTGKHLPAWFPAFAASCRASSSLADWLIFHDGVSVPYGLELPSNVALIDLGSEGMAQRLASIIPVDMEEQEDDGDGGKKGKGKGKGKQKGRAKDKQKHQREQLRKALPRALRKTPYMLIQFKPALGYIFRDYLDPYSHWAFADLDVVMGDLRRLVTPAELEHHDVITFSFGDQFRTYTRGQLTILQKSDWSLEAFRHCPYLQPDNVLRVLTAANPRDASTEGCFSYLLSKSSDLRVLYTPGLFSDANLPEDDYRHDGPTQPPADAGFYEVLVLYDGRVVRCSQKNQLLEDCLALTLTLPAPPAPQAATQLTAPLSSQGFHEVSVRKSSSSSSSCMWWVAREFQLCMAGTGPQDLLLRQNGSFYARPFAKIAEAGGEGKNDSQDGAHKGERVMGHWLAGTVEAVMMHFQEWKKDYPYWGVPSCPSPSYAGTLVTDVGFLPVPWPRSLASSDPTTLTQALSQRGQSSSVGRYCVAFAPPKRSQDAPNHLPLPRCTTWAYRAEPIVSSSSRDLFTQLTSPAPRPSSPLTLLLLSRGPHDVPLLQANTALWPGPKVIVALLEPSSALPDAYKPLLTKPHVTIVPFYTTSPSSPTPLKAMANAGLDAITQRYVLTLDPHRQALSPSTYPRLLTAVQHLADQRGVALLLPELSLDDITNGVTLPPSPSNSTCTHGPPLPASLLSHWHQVTLSPIDPDTPSSIHDLLLPVNQRKQHLRLPDLLPHLGNSPNGRELKARPAPPFLLDLLSPHGPLYLRHLEELGGSGCFDSLYLHSLLRMLDYHAYVMPGAHVLPATPPTTPEPCGCGVGDLTSTLRLWVRRLARQHNLNRAVAAISIHQHERQQPSWQDTAAQVA